MTLLCQTCLYDYNYILRYENISEEEKLFVEEMGASGDIWMEKLRER